MSHSGQKAKYSLRADVFRFAPDCVAKVENRTTPKISQKLIFGLLCDSIAFQSRQEGPWSILEEAIRSLTSPRVKRISGSKNFRSTPQKDFSQHNPPVSGHRRADPSLPRCANKRRTAVRQFWLVRHPSSQIFGVAARTLQAAIGRRMPLSSSSPTGSTVTASLTAISTRGLMSI